MIQGTEVVVAGAAARRTLLLVLALTAALTALSMAVAAEAHASPKHRPGWSRPFQLRAPMSADLLPAELAFSARGGRVAIVSGGASEEAPGDSRAELITGSATGGLSRAQAVPGAEQVLTLGYAGVKLDLVTATAPSGIACCLEAGSSLWQNGRFADSRRLVTGLQGATSAEELPIDGGLLAAVANAAGVWAAGAGSSGRFGRVVRLDAATAATPSVAASLLGAGRALIAWTDAVPGQSLPTAAQRIMTATARGTGVPRAGRAVLITPAGGYSLTGLQAVRHGSGATLGWTESWYTGAADTPHSSIELSDLASRLSPVTVSPAGAAAQGLALASDSHGDEVATWQACNAAGSCTAQAALRPAGRSWGPAQTLGAIDATDTPVAAQAAGGTALIAWIDGGRVLAATARPTARFGRPYTVSGGTQAANLVSGFAPSGVALAVWSEGLSTESLQAARLWP